MANLVSSLLTPYTHMVSSPVNYGETSHRHCFAFVFVVQPLNCVQLFETLWTAVHQASLSITIFQSLLKFMSIESVVPFNHLIFCHPLLLLPSIFPSIRVFPSELALLHQNQSTHTVGPLHPQFLYVQIQPTVDPKKKTHFFKISESFKKQNLKFAVQTTVYRTFTLYLSLM